MTNSSEKTLLSILGNRVDRSGDRPALFAKQDSQFSARTWAEIADDVRRTAAALVALGVGPGDRVAQLSENRYEWIVSDLAIQMALAIHVPLHSVLTGPQVAAQLADSGARFVILSTQQQAEKLAAVATLLPRDLQFASFERVDAVIAGRSVQHLPTAIAGVSDTAASDVQQRAVANLRSESFATILYTSGTTGEPKGVVLSQRNLVSNTLGKLQASPQGPDDLRLNFLPLSHIFARTCELYTWIAAGSQFALAESPETVLADCALLRPTLLNGVPHFYERVHQQLLSDGTAGVRGSLRELFGGRIRACYTGGAALPDHLFDFFQQQGLPILQGYGLTESSPVITYSEPEACKRGTVGRPIPGVEIKIAEDGEILTRGPHVMVRFWKDPAATNDVIRGGWLHTGDLGELDEDGYLKLTGRKKELIVLATGKNVVPSSLESRLCADPLIGQSLIVGHKRTYLSALIVPNVKNLDIELKSCGACMPSDTNSLSHPEVRAVYEERIARQLADLAHHEQVRRFTLVDQPFTIQRGELTPKRTLRRRVIEAHYAEQIEAMYREDRSC